jgi:acyl dehydratase
MTTTVHGLDGVRSLAGQDLGASSWLLVDQERVNTFADATGDHQWIHVDPERARGGPFGGTIAHGYLTLSMIPRMVWQIYTVEGLKMAVNYGSNKVRFPSPVPVDSRLRAGAELVGLERGPKGAQVTVRVTVEREGGDKPACVAEVVSVLAD